MIDDKGVVSKYRFLGLLIGFTLVTLFTVWLGFLYFPVIANPKGVHFILEPHESANLFSQNLAKQHIFRHPTLFKLLLRASGRDRELKAGLYYFPKGTTLAEIINEIADGKGILYRSFTIIPGWNFRQVRQALLANDKLQHTIDHLSDQEVMQHLGGQNGVEGQLSPDTYYYLEGSSDLALLKRAYLMMQQRLSKAWETRSENLPFKDPYQALIAASLIEREAYHNQERPIIAGVLVNRLRKNMLLQFDPTVIYGMGSRYNGNIHKKDLRENTPFNTYVHKGLPPTPIAMPSMQSVIAVLHPAQHDYLYFVARGDGSHQFSKTLPEHIKAIAEAAKFSPPYFNTQLVRYYLLKSYLRYL